MLLRMFVIFGMKLKNRSRRKRIIVFMCNFEGFKIVGVKGILDFFKIVREFEVK